MRISKKSLASCFMSGFFVLIPTVRLADARAAKDLPNLNNKLGMPTSSMPLYLTRTFTVLIMLSQCAGSINSFAETEASCSSLYFMINRAILLRLFEISLNFSSPPFLYNVYPYSISSSSFFANAVY